MIDLRWLSGFLVGLLWSAANFALTKGLLKMAVLKQEKSKLALFLLIKFPVLYLAGALILISRKFPVSSLLAGLTPIFIIILVLKLWKKN